MELVHDTFIDKPITEQFYEALRDLTLTQWGQSDNAYVRKILWKFYFPDSRPHIFHILHYRCSVSIKTMSLNSGLSKRQIAKNLTHARVLKKHVQEIAHYATQLEESYRSPKTWDGVNPVYMSIHRALRDPNRIRPYGDLDVD